MFPDLAPPFPLPKPGDRVQVAVASPVAPALLRHAAGRPRWCRVVEVKTGPEDLFPVVVRLPSGRHGAYQQHEIRGLQRAWWRKLLDGLL